MLVDLPKNKFRRWIHGDRDGRYKGVVYGPRPELPVCEKDARTPEPAPTAQDPERRQCGRCGDTFTPC